MASVHRVLNINQKTLERLRWKLPVFHIETLIGLFLFTIGAYITYSTISTFNGATIFNSWTKSIHVNGEITFVNRTNFSIGGEFTSKRIYEYKYVYTINGEKYIGSSFSTGETYHINQTVTILVQPDNHSHSKIFGLRTSPLHAFAILIIILPICGIYITHRGIRKGIRTYKIISNGVITKSAYRKYSKVEDEGIYKNFNFYYDQKGNKYRLTGYHRKSANAGELDIVYDRDKPEESFELSKSNVFGSYHMLKMLVTPHHSS